MTVALVRLAMVMMVWALRLSFMLLRALLGLNWAGLRLPRLHLAPRLFPRTRGGGQILAIGLGLVVLIAAAEVAVVAVIAIAVLGLLIAGVSMSFRLLAKGRAQPVWPDPLCSVRPV